MCPPCRERVGVGSFPFRRDAWSIGGLFSHCWDAFTANWAPLVLASVVLLGLYGAVSMAANLFAPLFDDSPTETLLFLGISQVVQTVVSLVLQLAMVQISIDVLLGEGVRLARVGHAVAKLGKAIVQYLLLLLVLWLPTAGLVLLPMFFAENPRTGLTVSLIALVVLAAPLLYAFLGILFMQYELVYDDDAGPLSAIRRSWQIAHGQRWAVLGVTLLSGLLMLGGLLVCCVGFLASYPLGSLLLAGLYLALRQGSGLPVPRRNAPGA